MCERERRTLEAIKLYNIAGAYETVIGCLAQALGECVGQPDGGGEEGKRVEATAREMYYHYSRLNRAAGKERDAVYMLLRIREAIAAKEAGRYEAALEVCSHISLCAHYLTFFRQSNLPILYLLRGIPRSLIGKPQSLRYHTTSLSNATYQRTCR